MTPLKKIILPILILLSQTLFGQDVPVLEWAKSLGGQQDGFRALTIDASGNTYLTGRFFDTEDFDPGSGVFNLTSVYADDPFLMKLDADGDFVWAITWGSIQDCPVGTVTVNGDGDLYVTGAFFGTIDFHPGAGVAQLTSEGSSDIYISKFDSDGNFLWVKSMGGSASESAGALKTDAAGNIYVSGTFNGIPDFDPGAGYEPLTSSGWSDAFVLKLDANANFQWVKKMGGTGYDGAASLHVDAASNVFITGNFQNTVDFDPGAGVVNLTSTGSRNTFVVKLDLNGDFVWARAMGGSNEVQSLSIATDNDGDVFVGGLFQDTPDFDPGAGVFALTSTGFDDVYVVKLNASGNFLWARNMGGVSIDRLTTMTIASDGSVYTSGLFQGTSDFDPGSGVHNMTSISGYDIFTSRLDNDGNYVWATHVRGVGGGWVTASVAEDPNGDIITAGSFTGPGDLDPGACSFMLNSGSFFIQKISNGTTGSTPQAQISMSGTTLTASAGDSYQWYLNGAEISGATEQSMQLNPLEYGIYKVEVSSTGCTAVSDDFVYLITHVNENESGIAVYPNPFAEKLSIELPMTGNATITIIDVLGRPVKKILLEKATTLDLNDLSSGTYILIIQKGAANYYHKVQKTK